MTEPIITKDNGLENIKWCKICKSFIYKQKMWENQCAACYARERITEEIDEMKSRIIFAMSALYDISIFSAEDYVNDQLKEIAKQIIEDGDK